MTPPLLLHVFPTFVPGGAQMRTVRLMEALGDSFRHAVLALDGETEAASLVPDSIPLELLPAFPKAGSLSTTRSLRTLLRRLRPDLLLTYNWGAMDAVLAARLAGGPPILHHEDGFGPDEAAGFKRRRVWTRRLLLRGAHAVVLPSHTLEGLARELWRLPVKRIRRIPNGVRTERFPPADQNPSLREELGIPQRSFVAGFVGHLRREKNPLRFLEAFAWFARESPDALDRAPHALILGKGPEEEALRTRTRELGLSARVHLVGHREDTPRFYRTMDAFCISSDTEQMPVALLEAMSASLSVVSTDVGDVARILPEPQREFLVQLPSPGESRSDDPARRLASMLVLLAASPEQGALLGSENRRRVREAYSFETMVEAYRTLFTGALAARA